MLQQKLNKQATGQILLRRLGSRLNDITASSALVGWSGSREWEWAQGMGCALRTQIDGLRNNSKFESYEEPLKTLHDRSGLRARVLRRINACVVFWALFIVCLERLRDLNFFMRLLAANLRSGSANLTLGQSSTRSSAVMNSPRLSASRYCCHLFGCKSVLEKLSFIYSCMFFFDRI